MCTKVISPLIYRSLKVKEIPFTYTYRLKSSSQSMSIIMPEVLEVEVKHIIEILTFSR